MFTDNNQLNKDFSKKGLVCKQEEPDSVTSGREIRFKSAGVRGLYGDPNNSNVVNESGDYSFRNKVKSRLL
jgi:hypothetical protein